MSDPIPPIGAGLPLAHAAMPAAIPAAQLPSPPATSPSAMWRSTAATLGELGERMLGSASAVAAPQFARVEQAALASLDPRDYLRTTLAATDLSVHVSTTMMKFHLSSSLGSAATGLFNTLLKNRE